MKILRFVIENIGRIEAFELDPNGEHVIIGGPNDSGKSTILDCIAGTIGGAKNRKKTLRRGAKKGQVVVDFGDFVVRWGVTANGTNSLALETAEGHVVKSPQAKLAKMFGRRPFDPQEFYDAKPEDLIKIVADLAGIDFADMERRRAEVFSERTVIGRLLKTAVGAFESAPSPPDGTPDEPVDIDPIVEELSDIRATLARNEATRDRHAAAERNRVEAQSEAESIAGRMQQREDDFVAGADREIEAAQKALDDAKRRKTKGLETVKAHSEERINHAQETLQEMTLKAEQLAAAVGELVDPDPAEVQVRLESARGINRAVEMKARRDELQGEVDRQRENREELTRQLEAIDTEKAEAIAAAPIPVDGLGITDGVVTFDGFATSELAASVRWRIAVALSIATNPEIQVVLIDRWNDLDATQRVVVRDMVDEAGCQILATTVGSTDEDITVEIVEGRIAP